MKNKILLVTTIVLSVFIFGVTNSYAEQSGTNGSVRWTLDDNGKFVEMQRALYNGETLTFETDKNYTDAKVMAWESIASTRPVCCFETVK